MVNPILKTPLGQEMTYLPQALKVALIAEQTASVSGIPLKRSRPLYQLASVVFDEIMAHRSVFCEKLITFLDSDLICYRHDHPRPLKEAEEERWGSLQTWFEQRFKVLLTTTHALNPLTQNDVTKERILECLISYDPFSLGGIYGVCRLAGSLIVALAVVEKHLSYKEAFEAMTLEESVQNAQWGEDDEALMRRKSLEDDLAQVERFIMLCQS